MIILFRVLITANLLLYPFYSVAHTLRCYDWLSGNSAGNSDYGTGVARDSSADQIGIMGQCRDRYPTVNERMKIERIGTDPFNSQYKVSRQYCWIRYPWMGDCGGPRVIIHWPDFWNIDFEWDPPDYECWGDDKRAYFSDEEANCEIDKSIYDNITRVKLCRVGAYSDFPHGGTNNSKKNWVCAYNVGGDPAFNSASGQGSMAASWFASSDQLIGCINIPKKPGPPPFFEVIKSSTEPYFDSTITLDSLISAGSRFDQPVAKMFLPDKNHGPPQELILRFRFYGDDTVYDGNNGLPSIPNYDAPVCGKFSDLATTYCTKVPNDTPDKICICEDSNDNCQNNIFLGCAPRPTPASSHLAFVGQYETYIDGDIQYPSISIMLAHTDRDNKPVLVDAEGANVYLNAENKYYKLDANNNTTGILAKEPLNFKRLILPKSPVLIREYYKDIASKQPNGSIVYKIAIGTGSLYGVAFKAIIPQFDNNNKPMKINVRTVKMRDCNYTGCIQDGCVVTTSEQNSALPSYFIPSGNRWRDTCCANPAISINTDGSTVEIPLTVEDMVQSCIVPQYQKTCRGSKYSTPEYKDKGTDSPPQNVIAELAVCPGSYEGPTIDTNSKIVAKDQICIVNDSAWGDALQSPYCVNMPSKCEAEKLPSQKNGYAVWLQADSNQSMIGFCDPAFGFEKKKEITIKIKKGQENDTQAIKDLDTANSQLKITKAQAELDNRNVQVAELLLTENLEYMIEEMDPTRQCISNAFSSSVQNPCVRVSQCGPISKSAPVNGNLTIPPPDPKDAYTKDITSKISTNTGSITSPAKVTSPIYGICGDGYQASQKPFLNCITNYYSSGGSIYITSQFWDPASSATCVKSK